MSVEIEATRKRLESFADTAARPEVCVSCGARKVLWNGSRKRKPSLLVGESVVHFAGIGCPRVRCKPCGLSWTLYPPGVVARLHFQPCVVARGVSEYVFGTGTSQASVAKRHCCTRHTLVRWLLWTSFLLDPGEALGTALAACGQPVLARTPPVAEIERKARLPRTRTWLEKAAQVLGLSELLAQALGLEPPGLRALIESRTASLYPIPDLARRLRPRTLAPSVA